MRKSTSPLVAGLLLLLCCRAIRAAEKSPDEILTGRGLAKSGVVLVLETDEKLPDRLRALRTAQKQLDDTARRRAEIERDEKKAVTAAAVAEHDYRDLLQRLDKSTDALQKRRLADQVKAMESAMHEAERARGEREKELAKLTDPRAEYINLLLDLSEAMEATRGQYDSLAADADVKTALGKLFEKTKLKYRLGPSAQFTQELANLRKQRAMVESSLIPVISAQAGPPHIKVHLHGINGTLLRPMRVDPDATLVLLTSNTAKDIGLTPPPVERKIHLIAPDGKANEVKVMILKSMRLGAFTVTNVECAVQPGSFKNPENVLGGPVLSGFTGHLDPAVGELRLSRLIVKAGAVKADDVSEVTFDATKPATQPDAPASDPAGKILLVSSYPGERATAVAACEKYNLAYDVTDSFNAATDDYRAYRAILATSNQMDYWGREENKPTDAFAHIDRFIESGGHLIVFGSFNSRNTEQLKPYGILSSYFHDDYFQPVPGLTDQLMAGNEDLLPEDHMLHSAGNFKCVSPHVVLLERAKKTGEDDGPLMVTIPWKKGRVTFNVVEPSWKQPHDGMWLLTATIGWVSRGASVEPMKAATRPTTRKLAATQPVAPPPAPATMAAKPLPEPPNGSPARPNIFNDPGATATKK